MLQLFYLGIHDTKPRESVSNDAEMKTTEKKKNNRIQQCTDVFPNRFHHQSYNMNHSWCIATIAEVRKLENSKLFASQQCFAHKREDLCQWFAIIIFPSASCCIFLRQEFRFIVFLLKTLNHTFFSSSSFFLTLEFHEAIL